MTNSIKRTVLLFFVLIVSLSCIPVETTNPEKAYKYWAKSDPPKDVKIIKGEYYQSPHFTLEYELYLKFKPTKKWWYGFIKENNLSIDNSDQQGIESSMLPKWFKPDSNYLIYSKNSSFDRSRYFIDTKKGVCYIYETVGM